MCIIRLAHISVHIVEEWFEYEEDNAAEEDDHHQHRAGVLPHHCPKVDLPFRHLSTLVHPDIVKVSGMEESWGLQCFCYCHFEFSSQPRGEGRVGEGRGGEGRGGEGRGG